MGAEDWQRAELEALLAVRPADYLQVDPGTVSDLALMAVVVLGALCALLASPALGALSLAAGLVYHAHCPSRPSALVLALPAAAVAFCGYRLAAGPTRGHFD